MSKICSATPEQWLDIDRIRERTITNQTCQYTDRQISQTVKDMFARMDESVDEVTVVDSPTEALRLDGKSPVYHSWWWQTWSAWYEAAQVLGVQFDGETLDIFTRWASHIPFIVLRDGNPIVSRRPIVIHWQDEELHNESGMSVEFADGTGVWSLNGVRVNRQIVMAPETQTLKQIRGEKNEEIKRIRIERFGWDHYLKGNHATLIETRRNDVENTREALFQCDDMRVLVCGCPSTGRIYSLEVPPEVASCSEAQNWIRNCPENRCIGAS